MDPLNPNSSPEDLHGLATRANTAATATEVAKAAESARATAVAQALAAEQSAQAAAAAAQAAIDAVGAPVPPVPVPTPVAVVAPASAVTPPAHPPVPPAPPTVLVQSTPTPPGGIVHQVIGWVAFALAIVAIFLFLFKTKDGEPVALSLFNTMSARINGQDARIDKVATDSSTALAVANSTAKRVDVLEPAVRLAQNTADEAKVIAIAASAASAKCKTCGGGSSGGNAGHTQRKADNGAGGSHTNTSCVESACTPRPVAVLRKRETNPDKDPSGFCGIVAEDGQQRAVAYLMLQPYHADGPQKGNLQIMQVKEMKKGPVERIEGAITNERHTDCSAALGYVERNWAKVVEKFHLPNTCFPVRKTA